MRGAHVLADRQRGAAIDRALQDHGHHDREQDGADGQQRNAGDLGRGEIGEAGRRLDLQAAAIGDRDRHHDQARRQGRDDGRDLAGCGSAHS